MVLLKTGIALEITSLWKEHTIFSEQITGKQELWIFNMKNEIINLINDNINNGASIETAGKVENEIIKKAEAELGLAFPPSYREFVSHFGCIEIDGRSFAGLFPDEDVNEDGSVVSFTIFQRKDLGLPKEYIALDFQDGDYLLCLNSSSVNAEGESPVVLVSPVSFEETKLNDSFYDYLIDYLSA